jgi:hypothetical protein
VTERKAPPEPEDPRIGPVLEILRDWQDSAMDERTAAQVLAAADAARANETRVHALVAASGHSAEDARLILTSLARAGWVLVLVDEDGSEPELGGRLSCPFADTVRERAARDPEFRKALEAG